MVSIQTGNLLDVVVEGKSIGIKQRDSDHRKHDIIWLPKPEGLRDVLTAEIKRLSPLPEVAPPNHALVQLLEAALLHPESAEGNVRQVIEALSATAPIVAPVVDAKTMAEKIADRWERRDLPMTSAIHSTERLQLQALVEHVIHNHLCAASFIQTGGREPTTNETQTALAHAKKLNAQTETVFTDSPGTWYGARLDNHPTTAAFELCATCLQVNAHEDECPEGYHPLAAPASTVAPQQSEDLITRTSAKAAWCYMCAKPERYKPAEPIEGSARLFHFQISDNWNAGPCLAQAINSVAPASPAALPDEAACLWKIDPETNYWRSACGTTYFNEDDPVTIHAGVLFCHHCGNRIEKTLSNPTGTRPFDKAVADWFKTDFVSALNPQLDRLIARLNAATTPPPPTLTRKAAEEIVKAWLWHTPAHDQERARTNIQTIIERCFSAESVDKDDNEG